jgi:hypothetical protein
MLSIALILKGLMIGYIDVFTNSSYRLWRYGAMAY